MSCLTIFLAVAPLLSTVQCCPLVAKHADDIVLELKLH